MRSKWFHSILMAALLLVAGTATHAQEGECHLTYLFNGWARATAAGAPNGAAFGLLVNLANEDDMLISVSSEAAEVVELHEMLMGEGDVMQMRPVEGGFAIPAQSFTTLAPGGFHIMLIGLKAPLVAGENLNLSLHFESGSEVKLSVPIRDDMQAIENMADSATEEPVEEIAAVDWGADCAGIHVLNAWARPSAPGAPNSAVYGLVLNLTDTENTLISVQSAAAETVELHEMLMGEGDVMQMRPVEGGVPLPAGGAALLQPGGLHIMLINLTSQLTDGDSLSIDLTFAEGEPLKLTVPIHEPAEPAMNMSGM